MLDVHHQFRNIYAQCRATTDSLTIIRNDSAVSPQIGGILIIAITLMIAALVLLLAPSLPEWNLSIFTPEPSFLEIKSVRHESESGQMIYDSRVTLYHNGTLKYLNNNLYAVFYRNQQRIPCILETMNGHLFVPTHHFGVQYIGGAGCQGDYWAPQEKIAIDFSDGTFHPGDLITVEVYMKPKSQLISRHSRTA